MEGQEKENRVSVSLTVLSVSISGRQANGRKGEELQKTRLQLGPAAAWLLCPLFLLKRHLEFKVRAPYTSSGMCK